MEDKIRIERKDLIELENLIPDGKVEEYIAERNVDRHLNDKFEFAKR